MRPQLLAILWACGPQGSEGAGPTCSDVFFADADGDGHGDPAVFVTECELPDGYAATPDDCDDADAATHPGADEICDDLDDDCDGTIDVDAIDASTWYADRDEDGFGDDLVTAVRCDIPAGHVDVGGDCDDVDAAVNPAETEICNAIDDDCDGLVDTDDPTLADGETWYVDADADHFGDPANAVVACTHPAGTVEDATDCNDSSADARPNGTEACDGLDNDCDGLTDDEDKPPILDTTVWHPDADGDGFGSSTGSVTSCVAPKGFLDNSDDCDDADPKAGAPEPAYSDRDHDGFGVDSGYGPAVACIGPDWASVAGDCNDYRADISPTTTEVCNYVDDNCDGLVDDDDPLVDATIRYADTDGDGFGDDTSTVASCDRVTGYVLKRGDCDDGDAEIHRGAPEYCDAIDNDCTGKADDDVVYVDWYADDDGDGYGDDADVKNDCVQPSGYALAPGDCDDETDEVSPAHDDVCVNGIDDDCDGVLDNCRVATSAADATLIGAEQEALGTTLAVADMDADGTADVVLGNPALDTAAGGVSIFLGPVSGTVDAADAIAITASVSDSYQWIGDGLVAGEMDLDGFDDLVVLAAGDVSLAPIASGIATYAFLGPVTGDLGTADADVTWLAADAANGYSRTAAILTDFDGDGGPDLAVGWTDGRVGGPGDVSVVSAAVSGGRDFDTDAIYVYEDPRGSVWIDECIAELGDQNGDGIDDLAICTFKGVWGRKAEAYVVLGGDAPGTYPVDLAASAIIDGVGSAMAGGDYDSDGIADLFGANPVAGVGGEVYAFLGPLSGSVATTDAAVRWESSDSEDGLGGSLHGLAVADVDGDELDDVLIGSPWSSERAYLQLGAASGVVDVSSLVSFAPDADDQSFGFSLGIVPDWTDDDKAEIAIGAPDLYDDSGETDGAAYLFYSDRIY